MKYRVKIRYMDGKEIFPTELECDDFRIYQGILVTIVFDNNDNKKEIEWYGIPLQHVRSYNVSNIDER